MRRVTQSVTLFQAKQRLLVYAATHGRGPHKANTLADVIWPDTNWVRSQGAGAAATRVLKKLHCVWDRSEFNWGWMLQFEPETTDDATARAVRSAESLLRNLT